MNFIEYLAQELPGDLTPDVVRQCVIAAAEKTVREYLDHGRITDSNLTNEEQAGIIAAVRLADPSFPRHALKKKIARISPKKKRFSIKL